MSLGEYKVMRRFLFTKQGRNDFAIHVITREYGYVTWEDTFLCLQSELLPDAIRAKFCELIIGRWRFNTLLLLSSLSCVLRYVPCVVIL